MKLIFTTLVLLMFLAYGLLCLLAPEKHLGFSAWLNRRARRNWHEQRAYTTPHLRMQRRWSQQTPASLRRMRLTGIAIIGVSLCGIWEFWRIHR
jgi:hypothetical protein